MSLDNIIKVSFGATNKCRTRPLYVLDYGIYLQINDDRIDDSTIYAVHFSKQKSGSYYSVIKTEQGVKIPEALLQSNGTIYAWLYYHTGESDGETLFEIEIPIITRPDTPAVIPTPHDHDLIEDAIAALNVGVEEAREYAAAADASAIDAAGNADDAAASATTAGNAATAAESSASTAYNHAQDANGYAVAAGNAQTAAETAQGKSETAQGKAEDAQTAAEAAAAQTALDVVAAGQSADAAAGSAGEASGYANDASGYATLAQGFANNASGFADNASGYATNAYNSATAAAGSAGEASGYATSASGYASAANDAKLAAQGAQTAAETAQGLAEAAQTGAEAAQTAAETARDAAIAATEDKAPVILDSASGAIVSIVDGAGGMNARSLVASMSPIQDLHGYSNPWPAGGYLNLAKPQVGTTNNFSYTNDNGVLTIERTGAVSGNPRIYFTASFSDCGLVDGRSYTAYSVEDAQYTLQCGIYNGSGGMAVLDIHSAYTFTYASSMANYRLGVWTNSPSDIPLNTKITFHAMLVKSGDTYTTFFPYSNICPISGRTGVTAYRTGVNVWDEEWELGTIDTNGSNQPSTTTIRSKNYISVLSGATYYYHSTETTGLRYYDINKSFLSTALCIKNNTFTVPANARFLRFVVLSGYGTTYLNNISINYPATDTDYHAYTGASYPVSWESEAGTVYGGMVDLVTGVLTVERYYFKGGWTQYNASNGYKAYKRDGLLAAFSDNDADNLPVSNMIGAFGSFNSSNMTKNIIQPPRKTNSTSAYLALLDGLNPDDVELSYLIRTPQTYQLDPQTVSMLLGNNNVWSTGDTVDLIYPCDTKLYMERLTAPTEDDMVANANIASGKYFMVGNRLFRSIASIPNGTEIIIGTNCVPLSLADALNALNE